MKYLNSLIIITVFGILMMPGCSREENLEFSNIQLIMSDGTKVSFSDNEVKQALLYLREVMNEEPAFISTECQHELILSSNTGEMILGLFEGGERCFIRHRTTDQIKDYVMNQEASLFFKNKLTHNEQRANQQR